MATYGTFVRAVDTGTSVFYENYTLYGRPGSSLRDEFNRLANGGSSYPAYDNYLDIPGAINKWLGYPAGSDILGTLNRSVGITDPKLFKEFNAVINYYLETMDEGLEVDPTGPEMQPQNFLEAVTALRLIPA
jgi:hypothetical protein